AGNIRPFFASRRCVLRWWGRGPEWRRRHRRRVPAQARETMRRARWRAWTSSRQRLVTWGLLYSGPRRWLTSWLTREAAWGMPFGMRKMSRRQWMRLAVALPSAGLFTRFRALASPYLNRVKITDIRAMAIQNIAGNCLIRIDTDSGLKGYGEAGATG